MSMPARRPRFVTSIRDGHATYVLSRSGRVVENDVSYLGFDRWERKSVAQLGSDALALFGRGFGVDWAIERDGALTLVDVRPIGDIVAAGLANVHRSGAAHQACA
jgi:hypothetical protein